MRPLLKTIALNGFIAFVYIVIGRLGDTLSPASGYERIVWFSSGLALSTAILFGPKILPGILLGSFASNFLNIYEGNHTSIEALFLGSGLIAIGATGSAFLGRWIYCTVSHGQNQLNGLKKSLTLIIPCSCLTPIVKAAFGYLALQFIDLSGPTSPIVFLASWWIGDTMGIIVFAPLLLAYESPKKILFPVSRFFEVIALILLTGFVATWLFAGYLPESLQGYPVSFAVFPPLIWAALRFTPWITSLIIFLFTLIASMGTVKGTGTFASSNITISLIILQIYLAVIAVIGLILSTLWDERQRNADELKQANTSIKASEDFLQAVISNLPVALFGKDINHEHRFALWNRMSEELFGLSSQEVIGKNDYDLFPKEQADFFLEKDFEVIRAGKILDIPEEIIDSKSRGRISLHTTKSIIRNADGSPRLLIGFSQDITERIRAENELKQISDELIRSNRELEQFAFVASHDLQEPLRKVIAFSHLLQEECSATLGENGKNYISRMSSACERMQMLIDDILRYSRLTTRANPIENCDLNAVIGAVLTDMDFTIQTAKAKFSIAPLPIVNADNSQMTQLFQNIISNAIKYATPNTPPIIKIDAQKNADGTLWKIRITDNGIGFDERFVDKIFQPFQRLHKKNEYQGTGIGLAICKKIIERHAGTITATSQPGNGACFIFTLPCKTEELE